jgi:hypothetical protein
MALTLHGTVSDNTVALDRKTATPLIINGDMAIAQRGTSSTSTGFQTCDRIQLATLNTDNFAFTVSQSSTSPDGFSTSQKLDCTTAESSLDADELVRFLYKLEGQNLQMLKYGSSASEEVSLSFYVRSNVTGVYVVEFRLNGSGSSTITKQYTISSANTWERKVLNLPTNTATAISNNNDNGLEMSFCLAAGSNFTTGSLGTSWANTATASRYSGQAANIMSSTDNEWFITGLQMEVGNFDANSIADFQFEDVGTSLNRCRRYCFVSGYSGDGGAKCIADFGIAIGATVVDSYMDLKPEMRAAPSMSNSGALNISNGSSAVAASAIAINSSINSRQFAGVRTTCSSGLTGGALYRIEEISSNGAKIILDAEL